jgi:hypothetical protein
MFTDSACNGKYWVTKLIIQYLAPVLILLLQHFIMNMLAGPWRGPMKAKAKEEEEEEEEKGLWSIPFIGSLIT